MPYPKIDASRLQVWPLSERKSYLDIRQIAADPDAVAELGSCAEAVEQLARRIVAARSRKASVMLVYGAHLIKNGASPLINWLLDGGWVTHVATQGAGVIHDWEFAYQGVSSESVRDNAPEGRFGAWDETGRWISLAAITGAAEGLGLGEALGKLVAEEMLELPEPGHLQELVRQDPAHELTAARADLLWVMKRHGVAAGKVAVPHPHKAYSVLARAFARQAPMTIHPGIGYDIITNHPLFHGGAIGRTSATDARVFAHSVSNLSGGVYISMGSAIMSPQIFEKAFSAANNLRRQNGLSPISDHYLAIVNLQDGGNWDWSRGEPPKENPAYYLRYCKSFHRMGGTLAYLQCDHRLVLAGLVNRLKG